MEHSMDIAYSSDERLLNEDYRSVSLDVLRQEYNKHKREYLAKKYSKECSQQNL